MTTTYQGFAGRRADGKLIKGLVPQFDGSPFAGDNCAAASEATRNRCDRAAKAAPGTPWPPTGANIRQGSGDTSGGLTPQQTAGVSYRRYHLDSDIRIVDWSVVIAKLRAGYEVTVLVRYKPISDAGWSGSPGFYGNHSIPLVGIKGSGTSIYLLSGDPTYCGRRAGIPEGPQWIKLSVFKKACADLDLDGHGMSLIERYGPNKVYMSAAIHPYTPPPPPPAGVVLHYGGKKLAKPRRYRLLYDRTNLRSSPRRTSTNVERVLNRRRADGSLYLFSAYQYAVNASGKWIGNKDGTRWLFFDGVKFHSYI